jgi:hypothetical protein
MIYMPQVKSAGLFGLLGTLSSDNSSSTSPHKPKFVDFKRQSHSYVGSLHNDFDSVP